MTTEIRKQVCRRTTGAHPRHKRRIVVTLGPGDTISLRLERERRGPFHLDVAMLYDQAELKHAAGLAGFDPRPRGRRARG